MVSPYSKYISGYNTVIKSSSGMKLKFINFDNAATTPPFLTCIQAIDRFSPWYSSIHRGTGYKSVLSSKLYEDSRVNIMKFAGADLNSDALIFVKNTTEAINQLSFILKDYIGDGFVILSHMEHHSNLLPWREKYNVDYIKIDENGRLDLNSLEDLLKKYNGKVKLVSVTGASNVTGYINPVSVIASICHRYGAMILIDGAQYIPHNKFSMHPGTSDDYIDYLAFSGHKMYAPFGSGVLIGPKDIFIKYGPDYSGGGTVKIVTDDAVIWDDPPFKNEAGTPNIIGALALSEAVSAINALNMSNIQKYEARLLKYTIGKISKIPDMTIYSKYKSPEENQGIISFNIEDFPHYTTAEILSNEGGFGIRSGCFCAHPYVQKLLNGTYEEIKYYLENPDNANKPGMVRISFGLYNSKAEIDALIILLNQIVNNKKYYLKKYVKKGEDVKF